MVAFKGVIDSQPVVFYAVEKKCRPVARLFLWISSRLRTPGVESIFFIILGIHRHLTRTPMFGLFKKDPVKQLEKEHEALLKQAMETQRGGDIKGYAKLMARAEELENEIIALRAKK